MQDHRYIQKRHLVRFGFASVLVLLAFSMVQAFLIQGMLSGEAQQIFQRHIREDDALTGLRRSMWMAASATRDYLVSPTPDTLRTFSQDLETLQATENRLLGELEAVPKPPEGIAQLRAMLDEYWSVLREVPASIGGMTPADRYAFIQQKVVPRRNAVGEAMRQLTRLSTRSLENDEQEFASTRSQNTRRLLLTLALSLVCALGVTFYSIRYSEQLERRNLQHFSDVERARLELQQLTARLMQVQEEERTRLARELHDEVGQTAAALRMELSRTAALSEQQLPRIRERISAAAEHSGRLLQTVRDICVLLRPTILDDLGLAPALQWQTEDFTRRTGVPCDFTVSGVSDDLPESVRTCAYRVLQEALHNCEKHSGCTQVVVTARQSGGWLELVIADDGCGMHLEANGMPAAPGRFGILGMRERAASSGGSLQLESRTDGGATVRLRVPIAPQPAPQAMENIEVNS